MRQPPATLRRRRPRRAHRSRRATAALALGLLALTAGPAAGAAQELAPRIEAARERLEAARAAELALMAPEAFAEAERRLREAAERQARGDRPERVRRALEEAAAALDRAEALREAGRAVLGDALAARAEALEVGAPERAAEAWAEAEREAREAGRRLERGERTAAAERAGAARRLYRAARHEALRIRVLGRAMAERSTALGRQAAELAPAAYARAEAALDSAGRLLVTEAGRRAEAEAGAERAAAGFRRAARIAALVDSLLGERLGPEALILRHEEAAGRAAVAAGLEPRPEEGVGPRLDRVAAVARGLREERDRLDRELAEAERREAGLAARLDSLEAALAEAEGRADELRARLGERERRDRRLREVRAIFSPEEGEVLIGEGRLLLRLYGLSFPTGEAEVLDEHHALLTKVQRVLREFPEAPVTVEGHTDARGNPERNRALSQRRAIAVREHLLAALPISADRIAAVGYGAERPVASNDTPEGRARNRRIDIVLDISGG